MQAAYSIIVYDSTKKCWRKYGREVSRKNAQKLAQELREFFPEVIVAKVYDSYYNWWNFHPSKYPKMLKILKTYK